MKNFILLFIVTSFCFASCAKKNPIVFEKKSDISVVNLSLDTNGTFHYTAKSKKGIPFDEKGTYTIEDTLLILHYEFESYEKDCYEIPLPNDTSLIMNYNGKVMLYPTVKNHPELGIFIKNDAELMENILKNYQSSDFARQVGVRYFTLKSGDMSLIFNGDWKISPYYDSKLH